MRHFRILAVVGVALWVWATPVLGNIYSFSADPLEGFFLSHSSYYEWGIRWDLAENERITEFTLTISNLSEWSGDPLNRLFVSFLENPRVLDSAPPGTDSVVARYDDPEPGYVNFFRHSPTVLNYTQVSGADPVTLNINLSELGLLDELNRAVRAGGRFGFGIDPDCEFSSDGATVGITTEAVLPGPIPAPGAVLLGVFGLGLVGWMRRRFA